MREDLKYVLFEEYPRYRIYKVFTLDGRYLYNECFHKKYKGVKVYNDLY